MQAFPGLSETIPCIISYNTMVFHHIIPHLRASIPLVSSSLATQKAATNIFVYIILVICKENTM